MQGERGTHRLGAAQGREVPLAYCHDISREVLEDGVEAKGWMAYSKDQVTNQQRDIVPSRQRGTTLLESVW